MKTSPLLAILLALLSLALPGCKMHEEQHEEGQQKIVVTSPKVMNVVITQQYVCQIHAQRHINVRALQDGYLEVINVKEGQPVEVDDILFSVVPILYESKWEAEKAEYNLAELELQYTKSLAAEKAVSLKEVALYEAKVARAKAKMILAKRELDFTKVKAPFNGIIDRLLEQQGTLVKKDDILTTLSDNSVMWVYFYVPERNYLAYKPRKDKSQANAPKLKLPDKDKSQEVSQKLKLPDSRIELKLADGSKFDYDAGDTVTVEARFNNEVGAVPFRADFPNPDRLLRHGMTGNILVHRTLKNVLVIPQRATYEILERQYVYVVDKENVVHQREIVKEYEQPDIYVIKGKENVVVHEREIVRGVAVDDKIVFEGARQLHDGKTVEFEFRPPEQILPNQQFPAE